MPQCSIKYKQNAVQTLDLKNNNSTNIDLSFDKNIVSNAWKLSVYFIDIRMLKTNLASPHSPPIL